MNFVTVGVCAIAKQLLHVFECIEQLFLDLLGRFVPVLLYDELVLQDLLNRQAAAWVVRADFLKEIFKRAARLIRAIDLPELVLLLTSEPFEMWVLRDRPSEGRKLKAHNEEGDRC